MNEQSQEFKAEVKELLNLMIHSLYSHKEVFLRELLSNASDAIDKARYAALTDSTVYEKDTDWKIKITVDRENNTLTVSDNGIGMSRSEIIESLGTIAHSGTREFLRQMQDAAAASKEADLIGQFGVGFYSSFMVAEKIRVLSRKAGLPPESAVLWESTGEGNFLVKDAIKEGRGTDVIVYLKEEERKYLQEWEIKGIVKKYSDFIEHPIFLDIEREKPSELDKTKTIKVREEEKINSQKALWLRDKAEITKEEYDEFYRHISHDFSAPHRVIHYKAEGAQEFTALLFIPSVAPLNIFYRDYKIGPMLYVRRVQIMKNCEDLIPEYLRFIKGVVDSSDLPLNVSREILQNNRQVEVIKKSITKKVLETLADMKNNEREEYEKFYRQFGRILKEGIHFDFSRQEQIGDLLLFESINRDAGSYCTLQDYIDSLKEGQEFIYYITAASHQEAVNSPYIEAFKKNGYDVLILTDEIDDILFSGFQFKEKQFKAVLKGDIDLQGEDKKEELKGKYGRLLDFMKEQLKEEVKDVRFSGRLTDSPCCLVYDEGDIDQRLEKLMKAMGRHVGQTKRILEINPSHPIYEAMNSLFEKEGQSDELKSYIKLLFEQALMLDGSKPNNPVELMKTISGLMINNLAVRLKA